MSAWEIVAILLAGMAAGTINTVVGSGTLITFPTLLAFGVPPVTANVSNTIGLVPGSVPGRGATGGSSPASARGCCAWRVRRCVGGLAGARAPAGAARGAFEAIVPALILIGVVLVIFQPRLSAWVARRDERAAAPSTTTAPGGCGRRCCWPGVYGGYFGAAQGVLLMAVLGIGVAESLQRLNARQERAGRLVNGVAGLLFVARGRRGLGGRRADRRGIGRSVACSGQASGGDSHHSPCA